MVLHRNAKLGLAGRYALVRAVEDGCSIERRPRPPSTSRRRPLHAGRGAGGRRAQQERATLVCLFDRSSRPQADAAAARRPRAAADLRCQAAHRLGPAAARRCDRPSRTRRSRRCSRGTGSRARRGPTREPARRYEWPCPGDLLHMDVSRYARFDAARPRGHRRSLARTARRSSEPAVGYDYAHAIVDDHSRLAYAELLDDERAATVTALRRPRARLLRRRTGSSRSG